jgi:putative FmdB family regulatory protein
MPVYTYKCKSCETPFELITSMSEYKSEQPCPECDGGIGGRTITEVSFVLKGSGWTGKNIKVNNQMLKRREIVGKRQEVLKREGPKMELAPNVNGERVDSWSEASKLAASKGLNAATYEPMVRKEKAGD